MGQRRDVLRHERLGRVIAEREELPAAPWRGAIDASM